MFGNLCACTVERVPNAEPDDFVDRELPFDQPATVARKRFLQPEEGRPSAGPLPCGVAFSGPT